MNIDDEILDSFLSPKTIAHNQRILEDGRLITLISESTIGTILGSIVKFNGIYLPDRRYTFNDGKTRIEVKNGSITHEFYVKKYKNKGLNIFVDCSRIYGFRLGCKVYLTNGSQVPNGIYRLKLFKWVKVLSGNIVRIGILKFNVK